MKCGNALFLYLFKSLSEVLKDQGETIFLCQKTQNQDVTGTWKKNGVKVKTGDRIHIWTEVIDDMKHFHLKIEKVIKQDEGIYTLQLSDGECYFHDVQVCKSNPYTNTFHFV